MTSLMVRPVRRADYQCWLRLWQGYLQFYEAALPDEITKRTWARFFAEIEPIHALVATKDGEMLGLAHYSFHPSSWSDLPYCYLEDLFAAENARGQGVGRSLIDAVLEEAARKPAARVYWHTRKDNQRARSLYDQVAAPTDLRVYRNLLAG